MDVDWTCNPPFNGEKLTYIYVDKLFFNLKGGVVMHHEQLEEGQLEAQENLCTLSNVTTF
jgi:hypothetical protein